MIKNIRNDFICIMVIFTILYDELFFSLLLASGKYADSGIKQYEAILYSLLVYPFLLLDIIRNKVNKYERRILAILLLILILYLLAPVFYGNPPTKYYFTFLLSYGAECIPAAIVGLYMAKTRNLEMINKMLPIFVFPSVILIGFLGFKTALMGEIVHEEAEDSGGLNYQAVSYFMAFAYTYCFYMYLYSRYENKYLNNTIKIFSLLSLFFSAVVCLMGGGRGAFLLLVIISLFMLVYYIVSFGLNRVKIFALLFFFLLIFWGIDSYFGIMQSAGMGRVLNNLSSDGTRENLYNLAYNAFLTSPIWGCGIGSIWWMVGAYSHNMVLDLLVEVGLLGTLSFIVIVYKYGRDLWSLSKSTDLCLLIFLVLICTLVNYAFSGYWMGAMRLFFVLPFVYCYKKRISCKYRNRITSNK